MSWAGGETSVPHAATAKKVVAATAVANARLMVVVVFMVVSLRVSGSLVDPGDGITVRPPEERLTVVDDG